MVNNILGINLFQKFSFILTLKMNGMMNNYNKSRNKGLIMLLWNLRDIIINIHINKRLMIKFDLFVIIILCLWNH